MRVISFHMAKRIKVDHAFCYRRADGLQRLDLRLRQAKPRELRGAGAPQLVVMEGIEGRFQPSPDRAGAVGGKLLRHHDGAEPGKACRPPAQIRPPGLSQDGREARIGLQQPLQRLVQIGVGMEKVGGHPSFVAL